ncbi:acyltransferase [cf. Phormidesmis sp. LEGE 11477]|uniref:acyltransferase family protein n=1 Tax=cf. Phormidesmis sp. LEGE 11477 TaxID=1828680 RepID=UPI00187E1014|nr:acyltransferase [cf. Phormidesmis sp. LEGE 11477]MBE9063077.1 acyltransferase [cf. Phormidesmis sp. LEGE 11477]
MRRSSTAYTALSRSLPILRGWAIVWIVAYHLLGNTKGYLALGETLSRLLEGGIKQTIDAALELLISTGDADVSVFIVISGFGLTSSWWKRYESQGIDHINLRDFWGQRVLRIFPLFWSAIALATLLYLINPAWAFFGQEVWSQGNFSALRALLATFSTIRNFIPDYYYFLNGAWWYVGLSLQLYLIFPFLIQIGKKRGWSKLLAYSLLFSLTYRAICAIALSGSIGLVISFAFFPARLFDFAFGIYLAAAFLQPSATFGNRSTAHLKSLGESSSEPVGKALDESSGSAVRRWLENLLFNPQYLAVNLGCFLTGLIFKWLDHPAFTIFSEVFITIGLFCGLVCLSQYKFLRFGALSQTLGRYSYGIYLIHMNIYLILWPIATPLIPSYWPRFLIITIACCLVGAGFELSYFWLHKQSFMRHKTL